MIRPVVAPSRVFKESDFFLLLGMVLEDGSLRGHGPIAGVA